MPAYAEYRRTVRPRERIYALVAVVIVQVALGLALLIGLRVPVTRGADVVERLIEVAIPPPEPPTPPPAPATSAMSEHRTSAAPKAQPKPLGGSPGPQPAHAPPSVTPIVAVRPNAAPSGGGSGTGPALGSGAGGGAGGRGYGGSGAGGTDIAQIAGDITPRDYPRHLAKAGIGGTVGMRFTVGVNGRVAHCIVTGSSGVPELDALTCRLVEQRFVYRPATDRSGRPVPDEVELEWTWD
ncbi:MAG: TonB family protein [Sphingomicrobium sp.]